MVMDRLVDVEVGDMLIFEVTAGQEVEIGSEYAVLDEEGNLINIEVEHTQYRPYGKLAVQAIVTLFALAN